MSDTPRSDALAGNPLRNPLQLCRQLERELARRKRTFDAYRTHVAEAKRSELEYWKKEHASADFAWKIDFERAEAAESSLAAAQAAKTHFEQRAYGAEEELKAANVQSDTWYHRLEAAEAKISAARRDALEEAAKEGMSEYTCPDCKCQFIGEPRCTTCGAERLYDATVETLSKQVDALRIQLSALRSIPGPATEEEIRAIWERKHLYAVMTSLEFCTGFRAGEARLLGRRKG